jgi:hypothetical protein
MAHRDLASRIHVGNAPIMLKKSFDVDDKIFSASWKRFLR